MSTESICPGRDHALEWQASGQGKLVLFTVKPTTSGLVLRTISPIRPVT